MGPALQRLGKRREHTNVIIVAVSANHDIRFSASWIDWLSVVFLDRIRFDEVSQRSKFDTRVFGCAAATGVDQNDDRIIDLGIYKGELSILVSLNYAKCRGVQPSAGEARRRTVVDILASRDHDRAGG